MKTFSIRTHTTMPCYIIFLHPEDDVDEVMGFSMFKLHILYH